MRPDVNVLGHACDAAFGRYLRLARLKRLHVQAGDPLGLAARLEALALRAWNRSVALMLRRRAFLPRPMPTFTRRA